jgi:hypothetical protein
MEMILYLLVIALAMYGVMKLAAHLIDYYKVYQRKPRPSRTDIVCPQTKRKLMDYEVFLGRCASCLVKNCGKVGEKGMAEVKKCERDIFKQCTNVKS